MDKSDNKKKQLQSEFNPDIGGLFCESSTDIETKNEKKLDSIEYHEDLKVLRNLFLLYNNNKISMMDSMIEYCEVNEMTFSELGDIIASNKEYKKKIYDLLVGERFIKAKGSKSTPKASSNFGFGNDFDDIFYDGGL